MALPVLFTILSHVRETEDHWVFYVGAASFVLGVAVRVWAQNHLHYRLSAPTTLTVTGPYAYVRNPIYIANTMMLTGMCFLSELVWFVPLMLLWCVVIYGIAVRHEEYRLHGKYADEYVRFRTHVPRWWARQRAWTPHGRAVKSRGYAWASILAECHCTLLVIPYVLKECLPL